MARRTGVWAAVLAVGAAVLGPLMVAAAPRAGAGEEKWDSARVATFNIRFGTANDGRHRWEHRRELCIGTIRALDADILGLQEALAFQIDEITAALPGYAVVGVGRDDGVRGGEHAAILVRTGRFAIDRAGTLWLSDTPEVPASASWGNRIPRIVTWARLIARDAGAMPVWVYNLHFDHESQPSRERSAAMIARLIDERPAWAGEEAVIVLGDFNAGEDHPAVRGLLEHGLRDSFRVVHPEASEVGTFTGFADRRDGEKIDHILVSARVRVLDAGIDRTRGADADGPGLHPSDHEAVWALLGLRGVTSP